MRANRPTPPIRTHEGAVAQRINPMQQLRRSVMSCLLWESEFYEDGEAIADRIVATARQVAPRELALLAMEVRDEMHLRHVPLLLCSVLAETGRGQRELVASTIAHCIQRADEIAELLAIHLKRHELERDDLARIVSNPMKIGLARAFAKFSPYNLAKYNRPNAIKMRDAMFLCHPKPDSPEQEQTYRQLVEGTLPIPDTWEVALSGGADKRETFTRLLQAGTLGYLALLRNLRNMAEAGVDDLLVRQAIERRRGAERVLPFRYIAAARAAPQFEPSLDVAFTATVNAVPRFEGRTAVLVDVSGSMTWALSQRSDMSRLDAAAALAAIVRGNKRVFSFSYEVVECPPRIGLSAIDAIAHSQPNGGTDLRSAIIYLNQRVAHDRLIVITDEQVRGRHGIPNPIARDAYMINVASNQNGVGYGRWTHIDGFSENVIRYIQELES